jgi:hypothetical protein
MDPTLQAVRLSLSGDSITLSGQRGPAAADAAAPACRAYFTGAIVKTYTAPAS